MSFEALPQVSMMVIGTFTILLLIVATATWYLKGKISRNEDRMTRAEALKKELDAIKDEACDMDKQEFDTRLQIITRGLDHLRSEYVKDH